MMETPLFNRKCGKCGKKIVATLDQNAMTTTWTCPDCEVMMSSNTDKGDVSQPKPKHAGGRPSTYDPKYCDAFVEFFENAQPSERTLTKETFNPDGTIKSREYKLTPNKLPTLVQFAKHINRGVRTVYDWIDPKHASFHPEFSQTVNGIKTIIQKDILMQGGLEGAYNPLVMKFVACNLTDMRDRIDTNHSGEITFPNVTIARDTGDDES